ncbi:MAG: glycosyltransferase [Acidimicrobiales bacterium]
MTELSAPVAVAEIELTRPLAPQLGEPTPGAAHALVLVRLHGIVVGVVILPRPGSVDAAELLAALVWTELGAEVRRHLAADGGAPIDGIDPAGLDAPSHCARSVAARQGAAGDPLVSVVIATRDRTDLLATCLDSMAALEHGNVEIIVVDNAPTTDATAELIAASYPSVRYVREDVPGLARAHNRGLAVAHGTIVAFTDDDVVVDPGWLTRITEAFASSPAVGAVTGLIFPRELETEAQLLLERHGGFTKGFRTTAFDLASNRPDDVLFPLTVGQIGSGANMAYDTELLRSIGGFDPALGTGTPARGGDDLSGMLEVLLAGRRIVFEPSAVVHHRHRRSMQDLAAQAEGYGVGLGAYLTSAFRSHPLLFLRLIPNVVTGARFAFSDDSERNAGRYAGWPPGLDRAERRGLASGPLAYLRSRRHHRQATAGGMR